MHGKTLFSMVEVCYNSEAVIRCSLSYCIRLKKGGLSVQTKLGGKFWCAMLIFGLMGQVAWVVENMYFNVFIYKMFHASASDISLMVMASAVTAALTTILMGAASDKLGRRKAFMSVGYLIWGVTIVSFAYIRSVALTIVMDCVMTFFGSTANDAAYNAWLTDRGDSSNRGRIEGLNSMMPLVSILIVFGGFMGFDLDLASSWKSIYYIIGVTTAVIGLLGFFLIEEAPEIRRERMPYLQTITYSFRPSTWAQHKALYRVLLCFAVFGISIQIFMPYLLIYYEQTLEMSNYVLVLAPAIILAAVVTALYGRVIDRRGYRFSVWPALLMLAGGYVLLYFFRSFLPVFVGSLLMMSGYLTGMAVFGAEIRDLIPENRAGQFQGVRIIGQVFIPGLIGPAIGAYILRNAAEIVNSDGTVSFLPDANIFLAALVVLILLFGILFALRNRNRDA